MKKRLIAISSEILSRELSIIPHETHEKNEGNFYSCFCVGFVGKELSLSIILVHFRNFSPIRAKRRE